ncbi:efflux RND transporter periplasmic adaptor subunit [Dechloromonas denitrificans]|uniref:efflux RND transporter periplasmic adaptor subunit n=1 Tax=Dechloromonas denitrificans TaxID=281362 RepID=UPI001CF81328|nr:efflux RND transporter periplasmic adaptor subunit [Dechloromonas denitrificans]UCV04843.1 efflux RND transporter periplasmic adaptor subunit [Dechloromonas denitrificans]
MKKKNHLGIVALALAGLLAVGYFAYVANRAPTNGPLPAAAAPGAGGAGGKPGGSAMAIEVARVKVSDFADDVAAVGTLKSRESVVLRPETPGRVSAVGFKDGSIVARGALLVALDAAIPEAELAQAKANLALAKSNHQRNQELLGKKFLSEQAVESSAATLKIQEAAVQLAAAKVARTRIVAPFKGMVGLRNISVGDYVKEGQDLINIEDIATLRVDFRLPESYLGRLKPGQSVEVTSDALPGERFPARLEAVDPLVDQGGRAISARARLDNAAGKLRPGLFVRVRLLFGERQAVLMVPEQAIVPGTQPAVYRVVDGKAVLVKVKLGVRRAAQVEVVDGLAADDVVVTAGQLKLREGAAVRAVGADTPAAGAAAK